MRLTVSTSLLCTLLLLGSTVGAQETSDLRAELALDHYDAGRYAEAREQFESLDADGLIDGPGLYRLSYCRRVTGDRAGEQDARVRALDRLEAENAEPVTLEIPFYLANALRNAGRANEAETVARVAVERYEAGGFPEPDDGITWFRLAKLYQDQNRAPLAAQYYRRSLTAFADDDRAYPANIVWARRFLGDVAYAAGDFETALTEFAAITVAEPAISQDLDRYASTAVRLERYAEASAAWRRVQKLDPTDDGANYRWRLAAQASELADIAKSDEQGRPWMELSKEDLELRMSDRVESAKTVLKAVETGERTDREVASAELQQLQSRFLGAALNYAIRRYPLRETAFFGGYAPFIFHASRWQLPQTKQKRVRPRQPPKTEQDATTGGV